VAKTAVADAVLFLTKIPVSQRSSLECLNSPKFWLSLAALCALNEEHPQSLSSSMFQNGASGRVMGI